MGGENEQARGWRQVPPGVCLFGISACPQDRLRAAARLTIARGFPSNLRNRSSPLAERVPMRSSYALLAFAAALLNANAARAERRMFIIANNPDGYGVDRCLAQRRCNCDRLLPFSGI